MAEAKKTTAHKDKPAKPAVKAASKKRPKVSFKRIGNFFRDVIGELRKTAWPTRKELVSYTIAVLVFVLVFTVIITEMDAVLLRGLNSLIALVTGIS